MNQEGVGNFDDYDSNGMSSSHTTHSKQFGFQKFMPDKDILAKSFWMIIQASPFGVITYSIAVFLEDFLKVFIASLILYPDELDVFFNLDQKSLDDSNQANNTAILNIIISGSLLAVLILSILSIVYLYRANKANEEAEQDAVPQIVAKIQSIFYTIFGTFLSIGYQFFVIYTFYFVGYSKNVTQTLNIIQIVLSIMIATLTVFFIFVHDNFYNLMFINNILVCGRPKRSTSYVIKPAFIFMMSSFSIKPHMTQTESIVFLVIISAYSTFHLLSTAIARMFYERNLDKINLIFKVIKTGSFISLLLNHSLGFNIKQIALIFIIVTPCVFGIAVIAKSWADGRIYDKLSINGPQVFKDMGDLEHAIYIVLDFLESDDPIMHQKFQSLILGNEERITEQEASYFKAMGEVIKLHDKLIEYGSIEEFDEQQEIVKNTQNVDEEDTLTPFAGKQHTSGEIILNEQPNDQTPPSSKSQIQEMKSFKKGAMIQTPQFQQDNKSISQSTTIIEGISGETMNHKLEDIFSNTGDQNNGIRRGQQIMMQGDRNLYKVNGIDVDLSNLPQAIKLIKLRYIYDVLIKQATVVQNENIVFLLMKAYVAMDLFHNKYLALTAITHVNVLAQKLGYKEHLISTISVNYFLKTILAKNGAQNTQHTSSTSWISQSLNTQAQISSELDSGLLLEQSLQIDEIINYIKQCSFRITQFWQITSSDSVSVDQIQSLWKISADISQMLRHIRTYVKQMESIDSFQSSCQTLCFYIAHFFTLVIRDKNMGTMIFRQMSLIGLMGRKQQKQSLIDEIGVAVVDGNFGLYGKLLFANKIFLKLLKYQSEEIQGKLIHQLMPNSIAEVHNLFWNQFSQVGIPKVLDSLRFLFVKDSNGYVSPFKIFIKFQYSPKYGYSFVGLFRKPSTIMFDEQDKAVKLKKTYQMICNSGGKILEISESCRTLMKLNPQIVDALHASMQENFLLNFFNPNLNINQMDFSKHPCVYYKNITLNLSLLKQFSQSFEFIEENANDSDLFLGLKENFRCQMKIMREQYGNSNSALVTLYYVIFTEASVQIIDRTGMLTSNGMTESANMALLPITKDTSVTGAVNESEYASLQAINKGSGSDSVLNPTASMSSTASSSIAGSAEDEIKMVEEGIDYDRSPKPLIYLKMATFFLFISLIVLASVQYGINTSNEQSNLEYQKILSKGLQNQELISQLTLMTRTYMNIQNGLESLSSDFLEDRTLLIRPMALTFIENIRINIGNLHDFFKRLSSSQSNDIEMLNIKNVTMFNILSNNVLEMRKVSRFYALNMWLVNLYQVFIYKNFTSSIGMYTNQNLSTSNISSFDQSLFFILANGQYDLKYQYSIFIDTAEKLINNQVDFTVNMNKYYVTITSVLIVLLIVMSIYFISVVLRFKVSVLTFFAEIDRESMLVSASTAKEFYRFLVNDEREQLERSKQVLDEYQKQKVQMMEQASESQANQFNYSIKMRQKMAESKKKKSQGKDKQNKKGVNPKAIFNIKMGKQDSKKSINDEDSEDASVDSGQEEEEKQNKKYSKSQKDPKKQGRQNKESQQSAEKGKDIQKQRRKKGDKGKKDKDESSEDEDEESNRKINQGGIFERETKSKNGSGQSGLQSISKIKNKVFAERLQDLMMKDLSRMIILGIVTALVLVAYFVVQLVLFSNNELQIKNNSQYIRTMLESMECTDTFIYQVRKLQTSNSSWYNLSDSAINRKIQFSNTYEEANRLNLTYQDCIKKNQRVDQLLQTYNQGEYQLQTLDKSNKTLCSYVLFNDSGISNQTYRAEDCLKIYQGVLQKSILQATSVFLQDSLYSAIRFMSPAQRNQRNESFIRDQISAKNWVELIDAHTFCLQNGLRRYYAQVIELIMSALDFNVLTALFIIFVSALVIVFFILQLFVMQRVKISFWHSFFILRLIPKDDMDREFIKRINEYLSQA